MLEAASSSTSVQPSGRPKRRSTNAGFRTAVPPPSAPSFGVVGGRRERIASVSVVPGCMTPVSVVDLAASLESVVHGVGHARTAPFSVGLPRLYVGPPSSPDAVGVGHRAATSWSLAPRRPCLRGMHGLAAFTASGVGHRAITSSLAPLTAIGVGQRFASCSSDGRPRLVVLLPVPLPEEPYDAALGVGEAASYGEDEDPPPDVGRSNVARSKRRPLRIVPAIGQVPEYVVEPSKSEA